jgi:hypothetical protein
MDYRWEKRDRRFSAITPIIEQMFAGAAEICTGLWAAYPQYRPFHDNENAGVSILLAGAARKELFPVSEFPVEKKTWSVIAKKRDGKRLSKKDNEDLITGRADLWISDGAKSFSFEFKKSSERENRPLGQRGTISDLERMLYWAADEVDRLDDVEYNHALGGIIAPVFDRSKDEIYRNFSHKSHLALSIGSEADYKVYFYFTGKRKLPPDKSPSSVPPN